MEFCRDLNGARRDIDRLGKILGREEKTPLTAPSFLSLFVDSRKPFLCHVNQGIDWTSATFERILKGQKGKRPELGELDRWRREGDEGLNLPSPTALDACLHISIDMPFKKRPISRLLSRP